MGLVKKYARHWARNDVGFADSRRCPSAIHSLSPSASVWELQKPGSLLAPSTSELRRPFVQSREPFLMLVQTSLSMWYPRHMIQTRFGIFWSGATLAGAFTGLVAFGISFMSGAGGLLGWSWIFVRLR